jgi:hypothetical protein
MQIVSSRQASHIETDMLYFSYASYIIVVVVVIVVSSAQQLSYQAQVGQRATHACEAEILPCTSLRHMQDSCGHCAALRAGGLPSERGATSHGACRRRHPT